MINWSRNVFVFQVREKCLVQAPLGAVVLIRGASADFI